MNKYSLNIGLCSCKLHGNVSVENVLRCAPCPPPTMSYEDFREHALNQRVILKDLCILSRRCFENSTAFDMYCPASMFPDCPKSTTVPTDITDTSTSIAAILTAVTVAVLLIFAVYCIRLKTQKKFRKTWSQRLKRIRQCNKEKQKETSCHHEPYEITALLNSHKERENPNTESLTFAKSDQPLKTMIEMERPFTPSEKSKPPTSEFTGKSAPLPSKITEGSRPTSELPKESVSTARLIEENKSSLELQEESERTQKITNESVSSSKEQGKDRLMSEFRKKEENFYALTKGLRPTENNAENDEKSDTCVVDIHVDDYKEENIQERKIPTCGNETNEAVSSHDSDDIHVNNDNDNSLEINNDNNKVNEADNDDDKSHDIDNDDDKSRDVDNGDYKSHDVDNGDYKSHDVDNDDDKSIVVDNDDDKSIDVDNDDDKSIDVDNDDDKLHADENDDEKTYDVDNYDDNSKEIYNENDKLHEVDNDDDKSRDTDSENDEFHDAVEENSQAIT